MEEDGIENNFPKKYQTRETADLFMAMIMHRLRHNTGRAAVVLPDGFLFGEGVKTTLKRELLEEFNLHTTVVKTVGETVGETVVKIVVKESHE